VLVYPDEESRARASERLLKRATTVESALGRIVPWEEAAKACVSAFQSVLGLELHPGDLSPQETARAEELKTVKYANPDWTENKKVEGH
jgi:lipoate-protein ligase A